MDELIRLFTDVDYLAECAASINLQTCLDIVRSEHVYHDLGHQNAYYCALPKSCFSTIGNAFPYLFVHNLYQSEEWEMIAEPHAGVTREQWKEYLRTIWLPTYLELDAEDKVTYQIVTYDEFVDGWLSGVSKVVDKVIQSLIQSIVQYGFAWHDKEYLLETETEYIDLHFYVSSF